MKQVTIDWSELELAFQDASWQANYYLDLETGEVIIVTEETQSELESLYEEYGDPEGEETFDIAAALAKSGLPDWQQEEVLRANRVEAGYGDSILAIPQANSRDGYEDMEAFIETVSNDRLQGMLEVAIQGRGAFRRFKDVLLDYPQERERWFAFQNQRLRQRITEWLAEEDVEPTNPPA